MIKGYLTTKQVAEKLGLSVGRVQQFVAEGRLAAVKVGHTNLIKEADLAKIGERHTGRPPKADTTRTA